MGTIRFAADVQVKWCKKHLLLKTTLGHKRKVLPITSFRASLYVKRLIPLIFSISTRPQQECSWLLHFMWSDNSTSFGINVMRFSPLKVCISASFRTGRLTCKWWYPCWGYIYLISDTSYNVTRCLVHVNMLTVSTDFIKLPYTKAFCFYWNKRLKLIQQSIVSLYAGLRTSGCRRQQRVCRFFCCSCSILTCSFWPTYPISNQHHPSSR